MDLAVILSTTRLRVVKNGMLQTCSPWDAFFRAEDIWTRLSCLGPSYNAFQPMLCSEQYIDVGEVLIMVGEKARKKGEEAFTYGEERLRSHGFTLIGESGAISYVTDRQRMDRLPDTCPSFTIVHGTRNVHVPIEGSEKLARYLRREYPQADVEFFSVEAGHGFLDKVEPASVVFLQKRLSDTFG
ncbi:hypothetical protein M011DRAFT_472888, partial [Sporormia fimetaria CBS 119925]